MSMPHEPEATLRYRRAVQTAQRSSDRAVQIAILASLVTPTDRSPLTPALRSDDPVVRAFAEAVSVAMDRRAEQEAEARAQARAQAEAQAQAEAESESRDAAPTEPPADNAPLK